MKNDSAQPLEIERKFLIEYPSLAWLEKQPDARRVEIVQTYLCSDASSSRRVRMWREDGLTNYYKSIKKPLSDTTRIEIEESVSSEEYYALLQEADPDRHPIRKTRWCIPYGGHCLEIDLYPFWDSKAVLECELENEDEEILFPPELNILSEVTADRRYLNSSLAGMSEEELRLL